MANTPYSRSLSAALSLAIASASMLLVQHRGSQKSGRTLRREISMGTAEWNVLESCVLLASRLSSGEFFDGLVIERTDTGTEFWKNSVRITDFPSAVNVELAFIVTKCNGKGREDEARIKSILEKLTFTVEWKDGLKSRPVREFTASNLRRASPNDMPNGTGDTEIGGRRPQRVADLFWIVDLAVKDDHVPLNESLIVTVSSEGHRQLARLSARL